jgi:hypothetical protein
MVLQVCASEDLQTNFYLPLFQIRHTYSYMLQPLPY